MVPNTLAIVVYWVGVGSCNYELNAGNILLNWKFNTFIRVAELQVVIDQNFQTTNNGHLYRNGKALHQATRRC